MRVLEFNTRAIGCYVRCGFSSLRREPDAVTLDGVSYADEIMRLDAPLRSFRRARPRRVGGARSGRTGS